VGKVTVEARLDWAKGILNDDQRSGSPSRPASSAGRDWLAGDGIDAGSVISNMSPATHEQPSIAASLTSFEIETHLPMNLKVYSI
jgi:hypothetical protein